MHPPIFEVNGNSGRKEIWEPGDTISKKSLNSKYEMMCYHREKDISICTKLTLLYNLMQHEWEFV